MEYQCLTQLSREKDKFGAKPTSTCRGPSLADHRHQLHRALGNRAMGRLIQAKLAINQPGDVYEQEADCAADQVMRMPDSAAAPLQCRPAGEAEAAIAPQIVHDVIGSASQPLDSTTRAFFEARFGYDFSEVRVHTDANAAESARAVNALAYTVGQDVVFGPGQFAPSTQAGMRLMAHELAHVVQQNGAPGLGQPQLAHGTVNRQAAHLQSISIHETARTPYIARVSAAMCSTDCEAPDDMEDAQSSHTITIYADKEAPFLLIPVRNKVGHSWIKLKNKTGAYWTFGFWPKTGFDASSPTKDVDGCVHHPDTSHSPTAWQTFELTDKEFNDAKDKAVSLCKTPPKYNLFGLQCTEFVTQVMAASGKGPVGGFGLIWESPNALQSWIKSNAFVLGLSYTAATSAPDGAGAGGFGLDASYTHQFYSALGNKLRLHWISRGELSSRIASLSTGVGTELTSQRIFLPSAYVFGGGIAGKLGGRDEKLGAGLTLGAGLRYNVDELITIGVEYNLIKDFVNRDPELNRLMLSAGFKF